MFGAKANRFSYAALYTYTLGVEAKQLINISFDFNDFLLFFYKKAFNLYYIFLKCYGAYDVLGKHLDANEQQFNIKLLEVDVIQAWNTLNQVHFICESKRMDVICVAGSLDAYLKLYCTTWTRNRSGG